jgi:hypothetical protein
MRLPVITGLIERRILANYRCDPAALAKLLPPNLRPKLFAGYGLAGVCLIRLKSIRPRGLPASFGVASENAAHRIAVQWDLFGQTHDGVYVLRRDTSSRFNKLVGGRLFAGVHHHADFDVKESADHFHIAMLSHDGSTRLALIAHVAEHLSAGSIFPSLSEASAFFQSGSRGFSPARHPGQLDGLELKIDNWSVQPLFVQQMSASFFDDAVNFPAGSATFDCALLMRNVEHEWHEIPAPPAAVAAFA